MLCRAANSRYQCARDAAKRHEGDHRGLVSAAEVRLFVRRLSELGIGYKTVCDAASYSRTSMVRILRGERTKIRADAAKRILAVDRSCVADGALISAAETRRLLRELIDLGYTRQWIARQLGSQAKTPSLQILRRDFVTARNASKVERLYRRLQAGEIAR
jgi:hypothetical protein